VSSCQIASKLAKWLYRYGDLTFLSKWRSFYEVEDERRPERDLLAPTD